MPSKSKAQQSAAALALQAKQGDIPVSKLRGASKEMYDSMSEEELKDFAETSREDLPDEVSENIRRHYVDEDVEIILNGERYVLEEGDEIAIKDKDATCEECGESISREDAHGWWVEESDQWGSVAKRNQRRKNQ